MLNKGEVRISQASSYSDSKNYAIKDDELNLFTRTLTPQHLVPENLRRPNEPCFLEQHHKAKGDFYIYCLAEKYTPRLIDDFGADSMLVIKDKELFKKRMLSAFMERMNFDKFLQTFTQVNYVDPLNTNPTQVILPFTKHFRYCYQNECRFVWAPSNFVEKLHEPVFINIGNMFDYAELIAIR